MRTSGTAVNKMGEQAEVQWGEGKGHNFMVQQDACLGMEGSLKINDQPIREWVTGILN